MEMKMQGEAEASWWKLMLIEAAKQELELLESKFPNQFEFFKNELKSIIPLHTDHPTSSATTQASTNVMKRKKEAAALQNRSTPTDTSNASTDVMKRKREEVALLNRRRRSHHRKSCRFSTPMGTSKASEDVVERMNEDERVDLALKRAKACIQKIHELKTQFLIC